MGPKKNLQLHPDANAIFVNFYTPKWTGEKGLYGKLESTGGNGRGVLQRVG
jgi:hypothetical protein